MDIKTLRNEVQEELVNNILPFWIDRMTDREHGGFYGQITGQDVLMPEADKGAVLNTRLLWTFSAAYRVLKKPEYLEAATRAKRYLIEHFYDPQYGGIYWSVDYQGRPLDTKKQIYAIGFAIYGFSEYARATGDAEALDYAIRLFETIEAHSYDARLNGYCEALTREWGPLADVRLSDKDENERLTMNTHLHILEPYANLYRVWKDERLERQLRNLIHIFMEKILNPKTGHLELFFNDNWVSKYRIISYGHDIEASWLLHEAAIVLGDKELLAKMEPLVEYIAAAAGEGIMPDGSMIYEHFPARKHTDTDRHWWVQAESVVGHVNLYQYFDDGVALLKAYRCWEFIKQHIIDRQHGEWYWSMHADGSGLTDGDKAGFWKCPYHNSRMCLELIERLA